MEEGKCIHVGTNQVVAGSEDEGIEHRVGGGGKKKKKGGYKGGVIRWECKGNGGKKG